jgi:hypothetical protein
VAKIGPYQNLIFDGLGDFDRFRAFFYVGVIVNFLFAVCMAILFVMCVVHSVRRRLISPELLTAIFCCFIAIVDPSRLLGITNVGERFIYPALILAVLSWDGADVCRRTACSLSAFLVVCLVYILAVLPKGAEVGAVPLNDIVNDAGSRYHILFWHRPFMYLHQVEAAQTSAVSGQSPSLRIAFETSIFLRKPENQARP